MIRRPPAGNVRRSQPPKEKKPSRFAALLRRPSAVDKKERVKRGRNAPKIASEDHPKAAAPGLSGTYVFAMCLVILLACGAFVYHLNVRFEGVRLGYETSKAKALQTRLLLERRELRLELASLKSPEQVEADAVEKLGMEVPDHERIIPIFGKRRLVSVSGGAL